MKRRNFLALTGLGFFGLGITTGNLTVSTEQRKKGSLIYITLGGGASHTEFFNPAPDAPAEYTSVIGHIATKTPGLRFGGLLPNLAACSDKFTVIKGFNHRDFNHASATHLVQTGNYNTRTPDTSQWPSYGSVVCKNRGNLNDRGMPTYIKLSKTVHNGGAWLGLDYEGFNASKEGAEDMIMKVPEDRFKRREALLAKVDKTKNISDPYLRLRQQAIGVLHGDASKVFNITKDSMYEQYKGSQFGKDLLTARRLVQGGAAVVTVNNPGWDHHSNIETNLKNRQPNIDKYLALLIDDVYNKGLEDDVMIVFTTEFGRTPKINTNSGRDHWARVVNLLLCGGKYKGGYIGEVDRTSSVVTEQPIFPADLCRTILEHCGISEDYTAIDNLQRPRIFIEEGSKII